MFIRSVEARDYHDIYSLNVSLNPKLAAFVAERVKEQIVNLISAKEDIILVAEEDNKVIGFIHGSPYHTMFSEPLLLIKALVVREDFRSIGLGSKLLESVEERAQALSLKGIRLNCRKEREKTHAFYERNGYKNTKQQLNFIKLF